LRDFGLGNINLWIKVNEEARKGRRLA
jgi:hypothetical protein